MERFICAETASLALLDRSRRLAVSELPILITGETGTGKEVLAREIHNAAGGGPFVVADCSVLNCETARSELFGFTKGSFTGALSDRRGLVDSARGGTLFIDEIGEATPETQMLFLRFLQSGEYRRVGETIDTQTAQLRIVTATNKDLEREVEQGRFRRDLFYRIAIGKIEIPPLRKRTKDVEVLLEYFTKKYERVAGSRLTLGFEERQNLLHYQWPGNVRELEHRVALLLAGERVCIHSRQPVPEENWMDRPFKIARRAADEAAVCAYLKARLVESGGNVSEASRLAGIGRQYFQSWMKRLGIQAKEYRDASRKGINRPVRSRSVTVRANDP
jgi:DNA-binding NtrC family response regulator